VTAAELAEELGVSVRTVYRDLATLAGEGAAIQGEAGIGYVMQPGLFLPPLGFDRDELDALALGLTWVQQRADPALAAAADNAMAKIHAMLTPEGRALLSHAHKALGSVEWNHDALEQSVREVAEAQGVKLGKLAQPLRAALTGRTTSPGIFDVLALLGKGESLARIEDQMLEPNE